MWWDGVWAGRRLDPRVCPIYKHTELDDTGVDNEVKVLTKRFAKLFSNTKFESMSVQNLIENKAILI